MKTLIITEKPSVARDIGKVLNCKKRGQGFIEGEDYVITWAVGHLINLYDPEDYDPALKKWRYESLPVIPETIQLKPYKKTRDQLKVIKSLIGRKDVDNLVCATDSGREGELIFRYIYRFLKAKKPFQRLWISSMTDEAIKKGFESLKPSTEYDNLYESARCRSEADWLVGINGTRAFTTLNGVKLSVGRVQTPTLALIVDRYHEIQNFIPQDYFEIVVDYKDFKGTWFNEKPSDTKIMDKSKAEAIIDKVADQDGLIKKIEKKKKKEKPPLLYDLTELQRDGNKMFGYSAKDVLTYAQNLYERHKLLTYPRTDSRYLSEDMKPVVKQTMNKLAVPPYDGAVKKVLDKGFKFSKRIIDDQKVTDHHAIIPTNVKPNTGRLSKAELDIYNLVVKRFIAVFYDEFIYETTTIITEVEKETFATKGKIVLQKGWKALYKAGKDDKDQELPKVEKGAKVHVHDTEMLTKQTSPPKPYTEATLLSAMENAGRFVDDEDLKEQLKESGFGTPATRAGIIERLLQVKYIYRKGKSLYPTDKGIKLIQIVPSELKSPETTGRWEKGLKKISSGELNPDKFMASINRFTGYIVVEARKSQNAVEFEKEQYGKGKRPQKSKEALEANSLGACPKCKKGYVLENQRAYYCSNWNDEEKCDFTTWKTSYDHEDLTILPEMIKEVLEKGKIEVKGSSKGYVLTLTDKGTVDIVGNNIMEKS